jgi:hypothetical protein
MSFLIHICKKSFWGQGMSWLTRLGLAFLVATLPWESVRMKLTLPKLGLGTPKLLELNCRGQNTSNYIVLYTIEKLLKCRCQKWARMGHLDICSTSYGKKKGLVPVWLPTTKSRESTRPRCVQVKCDAPLESSWGKIQIFFRPHPNWRSEQKVMIAQSPGSPNQDSFGTPPWESQDKKPFGCGCRREAQGEPWKGEGGNGPINH